MAPQITPNHIADAVVLLIIGQILVVIIKALVGAYKEGRARPGLYRTIADCEQIKRDCCVRDIKTELIEAGKLTSESRANVRNRLEQIDDNLERFDKWIEKSDERFELLLEKINKLDYKMLKISNEVSSVAKAMVVMKE